MVLILNYDTIKVIYMYKKLLYHVNFDKKESFH